MSLTMLDILNILPGRKKQSSSGWISFNSVCCHHRGHNMDKRSRGGIFIIDENSWNYNCFNCNFKCGFIKGKHLTTNTKKLLSWCGLDSIEIEKISFNSFASKSDNQPSDKIIKKINFVNKHLPENSQLIDQNNPKHRKHTEYLSSRSISLDNYDFYCVQNEKRERIIIPYFYENKLVGHTSRYYDNKHPKYISEQQSGYVFNINKQKKDWEYCILVEGQFDAMSIDGCAYLGSTINDDQAALINSLNKKIIVVPDRDKAGLSICNRALELNYSVSIPDWSKEIKDVNDAVKKYGKLYTLLSIIQSATANKIKVELSKKRIKL